MAIIAIANTLKLSTHKKRVDRIQFHKHLLSTFMYFWKLTTLKNFNEAHLINVYTCAQRIILNNGTYLKSSKNKL